MMMKKMACYLIFFLAACGGRDKQFDSGVLKTPHQSLDALCRDLVAGLQSQDSVWRDRIVTAEEIAQIAVREDSTLDSGGVEFMKLLISMDNHKQLNRWRVLAQKEWAGARYLGCKESGKTHKIKGILLHRGVEVSLQIDSIAVRFPFPGTVAQSGDGFKVYVMTDPTDSQRQ